MIFLKQFAVNFAVVIYHAQSALDRQIIVAEHVRPLQAEQQDHLGSPYADTLKRTECADCIRVAHVLHAFQIESAAAYLFGKIRDVFRLAEGHAERLQQGNTGCGDAVGGYRAERVLHALPDGRLCFCGNLLPDDMVHDRGKQVGVHCSVNMAEPVDDSGKSAVFGLEIIGFGLSVCEIPGCHFLMQTV